MVDRNNINDILKVIFDDFNWIIEDMTQYNCILKEKLMQCYAEDHFEDGDEFQQKYKDFKKLITKIENIKEEFSSISSDDNEKKQLINSNKDFYEDLRDWTDTNPEEILLFGKRYSIKYWRDILITLIEVLLKKNKSFIDNIEALDEFKGRTRLYFTYDESLIDVKYYKKLSNGLFVMVNSNANSIVILCRKVLRLAGYSDDDLKIKVTEESKVAIEDNNQIEADTELGIIKLPKKYASISLDKDMFKNIVYSIINRKNEFGTDYIEPRKMEYKFDSLILDKTNYTTSYHVVINIVKYLKDFRFIDNYPGTKKGKYTVVDDISLKTWIDNNI